MSKTLKQLTSEFILWALPPQTAHFAEKWDACAGTDVHRMIKEWPHLRVTDFDTSLTREQVIESVMEHPGTKTLISNFVLAVADRLCELKGVYPTLDYQKAAEPNRDSFEGACACILHFKLTYFIEATLQENYDVSELETCTPDLSDLSEVISETTTLIRGLTEAIVNRCFEAIGK